MAYREILGQEIVKDILTRFAASGKIPHALLFVGPPGTQKRETAAEFARILLCEASPSNGEACGSCQGCHLFELNSHPDVFFLNPKGKMRHVKMDETRELLRFLSLKPYLEKYKIAVLPDADTLSDASGNAILKFLEEPPEHTIFILISKNTSSLLPTIVSRCQIIEFHPVDLSLMTSWLEEQNHLPLPASILARLAKGCPGMVKGDRLGQLIENRELIFSIIEDWSKRGKLALIEGAESIVSFLNREKKKKEKEMEKQFKKGKSGKNKTRQASTEESGETFDETMDSEEVKADIEGKSRERLDGLLQICWDFFKDAALLQMGFSADKLIHADRIDLIRTAADKINHIEHHILFLNQFHKQLLFSNVNQKLALEMLFFNLFPV